MVHKSRKDTAEVLQYTWCNSDNKGGMVGRGRGGLLDKGKVS